MNNAGIKFHLEKLFLEATLTLILVPVSDSARLHYAIGKESFNTETVKRIVGQNQRSVKVC